LAAAIEEEFGLKPELVEGSGGVFDVTIDGSLAYSKSKACGEFPEHEEVFRLIRDCR
jgi:selT/selW/selH-like putative selenoprotein